MALPKLSILHFMAKLNMVPLAVEVYFAINHEALFNYCSYELLCYLSFKMSESEDGNAQEGNQKFSKRVQYLALGATCLIQFGEAVELYLPSVITQAVTCELHLTKRQEYLLALGLYISLAVAISGTIPFSNRFGRRPILLASMYLAIAITVLCALVPNFKSLLVSRILLGVSIASVAFTVSVYMSEIAQEPKFYTLALTLNTVFFTIGGGWCGGLGYMFLERIGWRYFILLASIPLFVAPLILIQFFLPESLSLNKVKPDERSMLLTSNTLVATNVNINKSFRSIITRIVKIFIYSIFRNFPFLGSVLLVPSVVQDDNLKHKTEHICGAIHGAQFLILTAMFGGCHILGKLGSYVSQNRISPASIITLCSLGSLIPLIPMNIFTDNIVLIMIGLGLIQVFGAMSETETFLISNDRQFMTTKYLALSSGIHTATVYLMFAFGNAVSEVFSYITVLRVQAGFCFGAFLTGLLFYTTD